MMSCNHDKNEPHFFNFGELITWIVIKPPLNFVNYKKSSTLQPTSSEECMYRLEPPCFRNVPPFFQSIRILIRFQYFKL